MHRAALPGGHEGWECDSRGAIRNGYAGLSIPFRGNHSKVTTDGRRLGDVTREFPRGLGPHGPIVAVGGLHPR